MQVRLSVHGDDDGAVRQLLDVYPKVASYLGHEGALAHGSEEHTPRFKLENMREEVRTASKRPSDMLGDARVDDWPNRICRGCIF